jgi:ribosome-binding factor A
MPSRRQKRVNSLLKKHLSKIIFQFFDFGESLVTVTEVDTSKDIKHATVRISVYPLESKDKILKKINDDIYQIQKALNNKLEMKFVPKIRFEFDQTGKKVQEVTEALKEAEADKKRKKND